MQEPATRRDRAEAIFQALRRAEEREELDEESAVERRVRRLQVAWGGRGPLDDPDGWNEG